VDWPRARAILLVAFTVVNLFLAYSIWGPTGFLAGLARDAHPENVSQLRRTLLERGLDLPVTVAVPRSPVSMRFLHVEVPPTPEYPDRAAEPSGDGQYRLGTASQPNGMPIRPSIDEESRAAVYWPRGAGLAAREVKLDNTERVLRVAEDYLHQAGLMPFGARFMAIRPRAESGNQVVEFMQYYNETPVLSGFVRVEVSGRGIEKVERLWVIPKGYNTDAPPKDVRPVGEALVRLAGRTDMRSRTIRDIHLGHYAGRPFTLDQEEAVNGWDTVPVWRITMENGDLYYINAFNLQWEEP